MEQDKIRAAVRDFLDLVENGVGSACDNDARLVIALDRLALAMNFSSSGLDDGEYPDPPKRDQVELRSLVSRRFPNYGYYNIPQSITEDIAESCCVVGDAIDDILDITNELLRVEWRWSHTGETDALWHLEFGFNAHWGKHLRELQLYLHALKRSL